MPFIIERGRRSGGRVNAYTLEEVAEHCSANDIWVACEGCVYDVSHFPQNHPGGAELILENAGTDISKVFGDLHVHSQYAWDILQDYQIGILLPERREEGQSQGEHVTRENPPIDSKQQIGGTGAASTKEELPPGRIADLRDDAFVDLTRPLMPQVWSNTWSKRYYLEQVHIPRYTDSTPRFFRQDWLEIFTKNTWWGVLLFWIPVIAGCLWYAGRALSLPTMVQLFVDGLVLWTVYEYVFHRFIFHMETVLPDHQLAFVLHFLMHGVHHFLPMDRYRLVMPPLLLVALSLPVVAMLRWMVGGAATAVLLAGSYTGYVCYDMMHYYFHHGGVVGGYVGRMKSYHMDHHYVDPNLGFGVSNLTWDAAFDTLLPLKRQRLRAA